MNQGIGHRQGGDVQDAQECFALALENCSNYLPVLRWYNPESPGVQEVDLVEEAARLKSEGGGSLVEILQR